MRFVLLVVALMSAGCGVSLRSSLDAWHPSGRVSQLDEADRALLARMVVDAPTDGAMDAREHIDELGEVGDADVRALLVSSLMWLDALRESGALDRLRGGGCPADPQDRGKGSQDDVIADLAAEGSARPIIDTFVYPERTSRSEVCRRARRALRAIAMTRAWLALYARGAGLLAVFTDAVRRLGDRSGSRCEPSTEAAVMVAITRHAYELDPDAPIASPHDAACFVMTIVGPVAVFEPLLGGDTEEVSREDRAARFVTLDQPHELFLERRDGEWRVIALQRFLCLDIQTYRRDAAP